MSSSSFQKSRQRRKSERRKSKAVTPEPPSRPPPSFSSSSSQPSLEPYIGKLECFELFSTNQCYYLVACDKHNTAYRVLKMDRTLIERPSSEHQDPTERANHKQSSSDTCFRQFRNARHGSDTYRKTYIEEIV